MGLNTAKHGVRRGGERRGEGYTRVMPFLAAVQTKLEPEAYTTSATFNEWILEQAQQAVRDRNADETTLIAFPEMIGLPLLLFLERQTKASTARDAMLELVREHGLETIWLGLRHGNWSLSSLVLTRTLHVFDAYTTAFARAARETNTFIVGGSVLLPTLEFEAARGLYISDGRVRNVSFMFAPSGRVLSRTPKLNLTGGLESSLGLSRGRLEEVQAVQTPLGTITTLICYDAFFETLLERADACGTRILVQPSANAAPWDGPWSADQTLREGTEWLRRGPVSRLQGRANLRYVVNPMLVGSLLDVHFEGRSSISLNRNLVSDVHSDEHGIIAIAANPTDSEVVTARIP